LLRAPAAVGTELASLALAPLAVADVGLSAAYCGLQNHTCLSKKIK
jgi:hypothetical protein